MNAGARILVVDDERSMREFLEIFLRREGYEVTTAEDVASGRLQLENEEFDVVISDIQMPDGSGLDLLKFAREHAPAAMVVMITAFGTPANTREAFKRGAFDFIEKPFKNDDVLTVVRNATEQRRLVIENQSLKRSLRQQSYHFGYF